VDVLDRHDGALVGVQAAQAEIEALLSLGVHFRGGQQLAPVDGQAYQAVYLASEEWAGQAAELERNGGLFTAAAGVDLLPPAAAVAAGRQAAFAIDACLLRGAIHA
jgi:hypothetical protein